MPSAQNTVAVRRHHCLLPPPSLRTMTAFGSAVVCNPWLPAAKLAQKNGLCKFVAITIFRLYCAIWVPKTSFLSFIIYHFRIHGCVRVLYYIYIFKFKFIIIYIYPPFSPLTTLVPQGCAECVRNREIFVWDGYAHIKIFVQGLCERLLISTQ